MACILGYWRWYIFFLSGIFSSSKFTMHSVRLLLLSLQLRPYKNRGKESCLDFHLTDLYGRHDELLLHDGEERLHRWLFVIVLLGVALFRDRTREIMCVNTFRWENGHIFVCAFSSSSSELLENEILSTVYTCTCTLYRQAFSFCNKNLRKKCKFRIFQHFG